jgi:F1F0 ATPase subunit 2
MMNDPALFVPLLVGVLLGGLFFGGLNWTVRRAMASAHVALWLFCSLWIRLGCLMVGLYWACGDQWPRWLAALLGVSLARWGITRFTRPVVVTQEKPHAS